VPKSLDAKCRKCRREGVKLFLKGERCLSPKCAIIRRNFPPGAHGTKGGKKHLTEYGTQLREKQKAKRIYGIFEKQLYNYYSKAIREQGDTGEIIKQMLQMRLDNVVYQLGLAKSRTQARQMVGHKLFFVNGKKVNIPSFQLSVKDEITIKPSKADSKIFAELDKKLENKEFPTWLSFDVKTMAGKVVSKPIGDELDKSFSPRLIVEFYSK